LNGKVKRAALIVMAGMIVSRLLGYVRYKTIFYYFGRGPETDAFLGAFAVPDLIYILESGGALTAAFIPVFTRLLEKENKEEAWRLFSAIVNISLAVILPSIALGMAFAPQLTRAIVPGFNSSPETHKLCYEIMRMLFPMVVFTGMSAILSGVLHAHQHFVAPTISWCLHNIGIISAAVFLGSIYGIKGLAYGVLAGTIGMVAVQLPVAVKKGVRYRPVMGRGDPNVKIVLKLFLPAMLGMSISQINLLILPVTFGSFMGEGAVTALQGSVRLLMLPLGIFGSAISMAIFPTLAQQAGSGRMDEFKSTLARGISATFAFSLPSMAVFIIAGAPISRVLFGGGQFSVDDCLATAFALSFYSVGLPAHTAIQVISRGYYSLNDTRTPLFVGLFSVAVITIPFSLGLVGLGAFSIDLFSWTIPMGWSMWVFKISPFFYLGKALAGLTFGGVALGVSLAALFNFAALLAILNRKAPGFDTRGVLKSFARVGAATAAAAAACWAAMSATSGLDPAAQTIASLAACGAVFIAAGKFLKVAEIDDMTGMTLKRFRRKQG